MKHSLFVAAAVAAFGFGAAQAGEKAGEMKAEKTTPQAAAAAPAAAAPADWEVELEAEFKKADTNKDGLVTAEEAKAYWKAVSDANVAEGKPAMTEDELAKHMEAFKELSGEDGKASLAEVKAFQVAQMEKAKAAEAAKAQSN